MREIFWLFVSHRKRRHTRAQYFRVVEPIFRVCITPSALLIGIFLSPFSYALILDSSLSIFLSVSCASWLPTFKQVPLSLTVFISLIFSLVFLSLWYLQVASFLPLFPPPSLSPFAPHSQNELDTTQNWITYPFLHAHFLSFPFPNEKHKIHIFTTRKENISTYKYKN